MTEDMPRPRLPYLRHEKSRHGRSCWYFKVAVKVVFGDRQIATWIIGAVLILLALWVLA